MMRAFTAAVKSALLLAAFAIATGLHVKDRDGDSTGTPGRHNPSGAGQMKSDIQRAKDTGLDKRPKQTGSSTPPKAKDPESTSTTALDQARQQALDDLPARNKGGRTSGYLLDSEGNRILNPYASGYKVDADGNPIPDGSEVNDPYLFTSQGRVPPPAPPPASDVQERLQASPSPLTRSNGLYGWRTDVEMQVAEAMRLQGVTNAELVINNPTGPCYSCDNTLPYMLDPGSSLTVSYPDADNAPVSDPPSYTGK